MIRIAEIYIYYNKVLAWTHLLPSVSYFFQKQDHLLAKLGKYEVAKRDKGDSLLRVVYCFFLFLQNSRIKAIAFADVLVVRYVSHDNMVSTWANSIVLSVNRQNTDELHKNGTKNKNKIL